MRLKQVISGLLVLGLATLLTGCASPKTTTKDGKIKILTSLNFYGEAAKQVAGKYGQVTAVINRASIDPHDFEPTVKTAKQASSAALIIDNGLGYDGWMSKLTTNKADGAKVLTVGTAVAGKTDGANEHVWYDPTTMPKLATAIAKQLGAIQPAHRQYFLKQAAKYQANLKPLTKLIKQLKANVHGQQVAVSEPVFDYALKSLGYQISNNHFAMAIEDGSDPSPKDIQQM